MVSLWFPWQLIFVSGHHGEHEEGPRCQYFEKKYLGAVHCWYKHLTLTTDAAVIMVTFGGGSGLSLLYVPKAKASLFFLISIKKISSILLYSLYHGPTKLLFSLFCAEGWFSWGRLFTTNFTEAALILRSSETPLKVIKLITHTHDLQKHLPHPKFLSLLKLMLLSPFLFYLGAQVYAWG